jgi:hypothetical protein
MIRDPIFLPDISSRIPPGLVGDEHASHPIFFQTRTLFRPRHRREKSPPGLPHTMQAHAQRPRVKICCIKSVAEARTTFARGAAALGLASHTQSGPGIIAESLIAEIAAGVARPRAYRRMHRFLRF